MKLFDRTPTGRLKTRRNRVSYSKTDKPLLHRLKRAFKSKKNQFYMIGICIVCLIFIILIIYSPTANSSQPNVTKSLEINNNNKQSKNSSINVDELMLNLKEKASNQLMNKFKNNPNGIDIDNIEQLLSHRNDLEKYLSGIDDLLLKHKQKISDVLPIIPDNNNNNINKKLREKKESRLKKNKKIIEQKKEKIQKNSIKMEKIEKEKDKISKLKELQSELHKKSVPNKKEKEKEQEQEQLDKSPSEIRGEIISEFKYAFNCYKKCAWGFDTVHPIKCTGTNDAFDLGLAMIDSLDTMIIMHENDADIELQNNIDSIKEWITNKMHFNLKKEVSLFESSIRVLGGLLSAYNLTHDEIYLTRATQLGDKLMYAFDTRTGIPYASVDFTSNKGFNPSWSRTATSTSEAASIQLEFNYLSYLTNDNKYANSARKSQDLVIAAQRKANPPLLRKFINIESATFTDNRISFGSRIDSTYEYYLKVPLQLGRHPATDSIWNMYIDSIATAETELFQYTAANNYLYIAEKSGGTISDQFDHLVCFIGGALALGSMQMDKTNELKEKHFNYGVHLTDTCYSIYEKTPTHLAPEIVYFSRTDKQNDFDIHARDKHNLLRPETVESIFYLWRITHQQKYRNYGYKIFAAFRQYTKMGEDGQAGCGYGSINDVTVKSKSQITFKGDKMESFFLAETLKYLYLLFCDDHIIDINKYIFNTEAHPLPRLTAKQADKLFK